MANEKSIDVRYTSGIFSTIPCGVSLEAPTDIEITYRNEMYPAAVKLVKNMGWRFIAKYDLLKCERYGFVINGIIVCDATVYADYVVFRYTTDLNDRVRESQVKNQ